MEKFFYGSLIRLSVPKRRTSYNNSNKKMKIESIFLFSAKNKKDFHSRRAAKETKIEIETIIKKFISIIQTFAS